MVDLQDPPQFEIKNYEDKLLYTSSCYDLQNVIVLYPNLTVLVFIIIYYRMNLSFH